MIDRHRAGVRMLRNSRSALLYPCCVLPAALRRIKPAADDAPHGAISRRVSRPGPGRAPGAIPWLMGT